MPPAAVRRYSVRLVRGFTAGHLHALVWKHIGLAATRAYAQDPGRSAHEGLLGCAARWLFLGAGDAEPCYPAFQGLPQPREAGAPHPPAEADGAAHRRRQHPRAARPLLRLQALRALSLVRDARADPRQLLEPLRPVRRARDRCRRGPAVGHRLGSGRVPGFPTLSVCRGGRASSLDESLAEVMGAILAHTRGRAFLHHLRSCLYCKGANAFASS